MMSLNNFSKQLFLLIGFLLIALSLTITKNAYSYFEDFEVYTAASDPVDWLDTGANNSMVQDASLFKVFDLGGGKAFGTTSTATNIHSHYTAETYDALTGILYTGRMMMTASNGGIGVTFLSQYPSTDTYYRLRRYSDNSFYLAPHPHGETVAGDIETDVYPVPNTWYWFKVQLQDAGGRTEIKAKVWAEGTTEPATWQVDAYDVGDGRLTSGKIGVWSHSSGSKYWDDLSVELLVPLNQPPVANCTVDPLLGLVPLEVNFDASASNDPDGTIILYEWDFNGDGTYDWSSSTSGTITYTYDSSGTYDATLRVTDDKGATDTTTVNITVYVPDQPPIILSHPIDLTVTEGETATFSVVAEGTEPIFYQWQKDGVDIPGATSPTCITPLTTFNDDGATFLCVVTNDYGFVTSDEAILNVITIISASLETEPVPTTGDSADDPCIWIHPTDPSLSSVIGTDKWTGMAVYDLAGNEIQYITDVIPNNVDIRYNFPLGGERVALVGFSGMVNNRIGFLKVNPDTRLLEDVTAREIIPGLDDSPYGFCMYHSPVTGKYYAFVTSMGIEAQQWELFDNGSGMVDATMVRSFEIGGRSEGCVVDDQLADFYVAEEDIGIWRYGAEPDDGTTRIMVDSNSAGGHLAVEVEGLTIYYSSDGTGYLIASSQGANEFVIYEREGDNAYVMTFDIVEGNRIDAVTFTDGIDVVNFPLNDTFPMGMFVVQDHINDDGNQNFKLVPWESIANGVFPPLTIDLSWDPREVGSNFLPPTITTQPQNQAVEEGQPATFTVMAEGTGPLTYQWQKNGGDISGTNSPTYITPPTVLDDDGGVFLCVVTNSQGSATSDPATLTVTSNNPPTADFSYAIKKKRVTFTDHTTDSDGTIVSWFWNFGDSKTSSDQNPIHRYTKFGTYTVTLTVNDDGGAANAISKTLTVTK
jgi:3-phytase